MPAPCAQIGMPSASGMTRVMFPPFACAPSVELSVESKETPARSAMISRTTPRWPRMNWGVHHEGVHPVPAVLVDDRGVAVERQVVVLGIAGDAQAAELRVEEVLGSGRDDVFRQPVGIVGEGDRADAEADARGVGVFEAIGNLVEAVRPGRQEGVLLLA